jgi:hypothetical protein
MVKAKTGTKRKLELERQSEVRYKHYVNQSANRITVIPNAIFALLLLNFRLYCTNYSGVGYMFCSMHLTQNEHSTHSSGPAAHSISTFNDNYFGHRRVVILSAQYRLSLHAAISNFPLRGGPRVLVRSTAGNITFRLTVLTVGSLWPADMHRT